MAAALALALPGSGFAQQAQDTAALTERLFTAVRANDIATVRLVLTNGADPMALDANGQTPAGIAIDRGYFEIAHHILGVRNQRQALIRREGDDDRSNPRIAASRPAAPGAERTPDVTWRQNAAPGQAAEIPPPRLSSPQEATVITPAMVISGPTRATQAQQKKTAETPAPTAKTAAAPSAVSPQSAQPATSLANLPAMPAGAPNPFDPQSAEPNPLPVLTSTEPTVRPAVASTDKPRETSSGNVLSRFFNGITGVFGGGGS
jgi:hypothetical protein